MNKLWNLYGAGLALVAMLVTSAAYPHAAEDRVRSFHGGLAQGAGAFHLELVLVDGLAALYLYDLQNAPLANDETTGSAQIWLADRQIELPWLPDGRKRLIASGAFKATDVRRVVVSLDRPGYRPVTVSFLIPASAAGSSAPP